MVKNTKRYVVFNGEFENGQTKKMQFLENMFSLFSDFFGSTDTGCLNSICTKKTLIRVLPVYI